MNKRERAAYRIAGQAIGALLVGARIDSVSIDHGVEFSASERPAQERPSDDELLARILVILIGVGAAYAYSFGKASLSPRPDDPICQRDVEAVDALSNELAEIPSTGLDVVWRYAAEVVGQPDVWHAVDVVAAKLLDGMIDGEMLMTLCRTGIAGRQR